MHTPKLVCPKSEYWCRKRPVSSPRVIYTLKKAFPIVQFGRNSLKMSVLFHMKSETRFLLLAVIVWKCEYFFNFLAKCFIIVCFRFSCMYFFWPLGWLWLIKKFVYIWFSWTFSLQLFPALFQVEKSGTAQWLSSSGSVRLVSL